MPTEPGQSFGHFCNRLIGEAGMGALVFTLDTKLNRNVALKVHLSDQGAYFVKM